jgi:hypothetical protein
MRKKVPLLRFLLLLASATILLLGCPVHRSLKPMGGLYVETIPSSRVYLSNINVKQNGGDLVISGEVSRRNTAFSGLGHVDVAVVSSDGVVMAQGIAPYSPKILPKTPGARKHRPSRFELHLTCTPPGGSIIRVAYHGQPDSSDSLLDHERNYAVPESHDQGG